MASKITVPNPRYTWPHYSFVAHALGPAFLRLNGGFRVSGAENVPATGPALLCPNHVSYLDPPVVAMGFSRRTCFMAKKELFGIPGLGPFIARSYAYPVDREEGGRQAIRTAVVLLKAGELLVMFPEGTRSQDGELEQGKLGPAFIASRTGAPIVPVAIWGTDVVLPLHTRRLYRCPVCIRYGEPMPAPRADDGGRVAKKQLNEYTLELMSGIRGLMDEIKAELPPQVLARAERMKARWRQIHADTATQPTEGD